MNTGVIISTYNSPLWLEKVLWGYEHQSDKAFEIIIADDGSSSQTLQLIEAFKKRKKLHISHIWHEDKGFRKTEILNKAIASTDCDYLIFTDGDCIPRKDFVSTHKINAKKGSFISAGYYKLSMPVSNKINEEDIQSAMAFSYKWLIAQGQPKSHKSLKLTCKFDTILNLLTPTKATWNGANSSAFKSDILSVNGFDERMQYGAEDVEMGERMINKGCKTIQLRYSAVCIHLDHTRGYVHSDMWKKNSAIRKETLKHRKEWTDYGINKH